MKKNISTFTHQFGSLEFLRVENRLAVFFPDTKKKKKKNLERASPAIPCLGSGAVCANRKASRGLHMSGAAR